jgi:hypothetical protein
MKKRNLSLIIVLLVTLAAEMAIAQSVNVKASADTGDPGDKITFTYSYDLGGYTYDRTEIKFDGAPLDRVDGAINNDGEFIWTATPGTHVFRLFLRFITGKDSDGKNIKKSLQTMAIVQISGWETNEFSHPGLSLSSEEIEVIKKNVFGSAPHPMKDAWNKLYVDVNHKPQAVEIVKWPDDKAKWDGDGNGIYRLALKWAISGEDKYGAAAVRILNDWGSTCKKMWDNGVYPFLHVTHRMDGWLLAAEILKHYNGGYSGWSKADIKVYDEQYVRGVLVPMALGWWGNVGHPYSTQNQPLNVAKSRIMIGIYLDDKALFQSGYDHLFNTLHGDH